MFLIVNISRNFTGEGAFTETTAETVEDRIVRLVPDTAGYTPQGKNETRFCNYSIIVSTSCLSVSVQQIMSMLGAYITIMIQLDNQNDEEKR